MKHLLYILTIFTYSNLYSAKIGFIHGNYYANGSRNIDPSCLKSFLEEKGHTIEGTCFAEADKYDVLISQNLLANVYVRNVKKRKKIASKTIKLTHEVKFFDPNSYNKKILNDYRRVFSFEHKLCDNKKYKKMFYPWLVYIDQDVIDKVRNDLKFANSFNKAFSFENSWNHPKFITFNFTDIITLSDKFIPFSKRNLSCMINSVIRVRNNPEENYSKRLKIAKFYNKFHPKDLTLYGGRGWNKYKINIYKGICPKNILPHIFRSHKFNYCYDNWNNNIHYISEKIQRCFNNLCVPIYLGCKNITDYIPADTFIDARNFSSIEDIHAYISTMDEETWMGYINAIRRFILSDQAKKFTRENLAKRLVETVEEVLKEIEQEKKQHK